MTLPAFKSDREEQQPMATPATFKSDENKEQYYKLFAGVKEKLEKAETITAIFCILSRDCTSFLNCNIFLSILNYCHIEIDCEELKYFDNLKAYVKKHNISEFLKINPKLEKFTKDSQKVHIKLDIESTSKLNRIFDIKDRLCDILDISPSALRLFSIKDGCLVAIFLIPAQIAPVVIEKVAATNKEEFQALSLLWLKCKGCKIYFREHDFPGRTSE